MSSIGVPTVTTVTLVTGDQVVVTTTAGGQVSYRPRPVSAGSSAFDTFRIGGDYYAIPASALPYAGRTLNLSLFDVSALVRDGVTAGSRIPVTLALTGGTSSTPPGVTPTSTGHGYLTARSAAAFSAALRRNTAADRAAGRPAGTTPAFAGVASIGLDAPAPDPSRPVGAHPDYPLHTLQIKATDFTGAAANIAIVLTNTDNMQRESVLLPVSDGLARIEVPAGHYGINTVFGDVDTKGNLLALRMVSTNDLTVPTTAGVTTTTALDEREATSLISSSTPRPATEDTITVNWIRQDTTGVNVGSGTFSWGTVPVYTNSQPKAAVGRLHYQVQWGAAGPATGSRYRYNLAYGFDHIPANEAFGSTPAQIATVHEHFSADPASTGGGSFLNGADDAFTSGGEIGPLDLQPMPGDLTQYLGTGDGGIWEEGDGTPTQEQIQGSPRSYAGGRQYSVDWAHGPLAPEYGQWAGIQTCLLCATKTGVALAFNTVADSEPDHYGFPFVGAFHLALYRNGASVFKGAAIGAQITGLKNSAGIYRAVLDANMAGVGVSQSTSSHTDLTVVYNGHGDSADALPATDYCTLQNAPDAKPPCQILPALSLNYRLVSDETNTSRLPLQAMGLNVGHLSYNGIGSHAAITSVSVSVSFDGGKTWQSARVFGKNGHYVAAWQNPKSAAGTSPALKVTAKDAIGGSITQTVANAYTLAKSLK